LYPNSVSAEHQVAAIGVFRGAPGVRAYFIAGGWDQDLPDDLGARLAGGSLAPRSAGDRRYRPARPMQPARGHGPDVSVRAGGRARAWDENADPFTNAVRVAVMTLRRKLGQPPVIETVPGAGYQLGP
jgi:hypothetical protein